ncbi:MAG: hypothetical protein IBX70_07760 [Clostridia bacterium]|nr:hypothetical protein [Clostridia bacterium]
MSRRLHDFPQNFAGEAKFNKWFDFKGFALFLLGVSVWIFLANTIGIFIPIAAHAIGFLLTLTLVLIYSVKIPAEFYNKMGNERIYKLIYSSIIHKRRKVIYSNTVRGEET